MARQHTARHTGAEPRHKLAQARALDRKALTCRISMLTQGHDTRSHSCNGHHHDADAALMRHSWDGSPSLCTDSNSYSSINFQGHTRVPGLWQRIKAAELHRPVCGCWHSRKRGGCAGPCPWTHEGGPWRLGAVNPTANATQQQAQPPARIRQLATKRRAKRTTCRHLTPSHPILWSTQAPLEQRREHRKGLLLHEHDAK